MKITKYILIGVGFIICILAYCAIYLPPGELTLDDCLEFGICAEGLALKDDGKDIIMTKEYCISHNYTWSDIYLSCDTRNLANKEK